MMHLPILSAFAGFSISISFVCALGAQNLLLLAQGARGGPILPVAGICYAWECILLARTAAGLLFLTPTTILALRFAGLACLICYGCLAVMAMLRPRGAERHSPAISPITAALAVSLGNPLIWIETIVLTGGIVLQFSGPERLGCLAGALLAGAIRIFGLVYGARQMAPLLRRALAGSAGNAVMAAAMFGNAAILLGRLVPTVL